VEQILPGLQPGVRQLYAAAGTLRHVGRQHGPEDRRPERGYNVED
jgi:hypothetical protein